MYVHDISPLAEATVKRILKGKEKIGDDRTHFVRQERLGIFERISPVEFAQLPSNVKSARVLKRIEEIIKTKWEEREAMEAQDFEEHQEQEPARRKKKRRANEAQEEIPNPPPRQRGGMFRGGMFHGDYQQPPDDNAMNRIIIDTESLIDENRALSTLDQDRNICHLVKTDSQNLNIDNAILLIVDNKFSIYIVHTITRSETTIKCTTIHVLDNMSQTHAMAVNTQVYALTAKSIRHFGDASFANLDLNLADIKPFSGALPVDQPSDARSDAAGLGLVAALNGFKGSQNRTPGGMGRLTLSAATVLSDNPREMLATGNNIIFHRIYSPETSAVWSLQRTPAMQIQPEHLILLVQSLSSVPIELFADLGDLFSPDAAEKAVRKFGHSRNEIDKTLVADTNVIAGITSNARNCLVNFCVTLNALLDLKVEIREALRHTIDKFIVFIVPRLLGPGEEASVKILSALVNHFQVEVDKRYMRVVAGIVTSTDMLIEEIHGITLSDNAILGIEILQLRLQSTGTPNARAERRARKNLLKHPKTPKIPPTAAGSQPSSPPGKQPGSICGFWMSTKGCSRISDCSREHRDPTTVAEKADVDFFFSKRGKNFTRKV